MKSYRRWMTAALLLALAATGAVVSAQDKAQEKAAARQKAARDVIMQREGGAVFFAGQEPSADRMWFGDAETSLFVASEMLMGGHAVKGAPYSAQATTEMIQTLADGNRIVRKTTANVYRDSEGRTRNDQAMGNVGPYATANEPSQVIMINDPVSDAHYMLDARTKTARKMNYFNVKVAGNAKTLTNVTVNADAAASADKHAAEADAVTATVEVRPPAGARMRVPGPKGEAMLGDMQTFSFKKHEPKMEQLGKQTIEGVEAEGQRATITIPAGEIGNEQPIQIVSESWYSPELQVTVMSRHSDPRIGETVYKLTNINHAEPAHSLFELPADYTVKETVEPKIKMMLDRELQRARKSADKQDN